MFFVVAGRAKVGEFLGSVDGRRSGAEESTQPIGRVADVACMAIVDPGSQTVVAAYCRDCRNTLFARPARFALWGRCAYRVDLDWRSIVGRGWA